ncbi:MAG: alkaline phosphatase family protein [Betaproteobacteria bacterium]|nr:alkaline phosphatase family protein [Betaproteobacteria bacterium]
MKTSPLARLAFVAFAALVILSGCAAAPPASESADRPRLVVLIVVDGLPQGQVTGYRDHFGPGGLNRFLEQGAWFADAHYGHANTLTGPGHAVILTGAYPHRTGIIGNDWRDPVTGEPVYCAGDPAHGYLGHQTSKFAGTSPKNLEVESLGDVLRHADARSKVIAISGKDRGAILPAGRDGTAYIFMAQTGQFASTTYYMKEHPAWVTVFNGAKPADRYFKATWSPLLPAMAYARSLPDGQAWFAPGGRLPMVIGEGQDSPGPRYYANLESSPFLDALALDFARAAIEGESLGSDEAPDILVVSLSTHDYVNHAWSAESRLSHDHLLQLDNLFAAFFRDLDRKLGKDHYVAILTSDHGFMPAPEFLLSRGREGGRLASGRMVARLNAGLDGKFGEGQWARGMSAQGILFDRALIARKGVDPVALGAEAKRILLAEPGIAGVFTRAEVEDSSTPPAPFLDAVRAGWHRERSADLQVVLKPGWMFSSSRIGATHGSPHPYDTHVPILLYGPKWVKPGRIDARVEVVDIAPTLAGLLGIAVPSSSEGRPLPLPP